MSAEPAIAPSPPSEIHSRGDAPRWQPLSGGWAVWIFMTVEVLTFGAFLVAHTWGWRALPDVYLASQAQLHVVSGVRGTALLLVGSWLVYQGLLANAESRGRTTARWFYAAAVAGALFCLNKIIEYQSPELAAVTLSTNRFWFSYLFLTGLHLLHVLAGVGALAWFGFEAGRGRCGATNALGIEACAAYWHLVDVIWVLLFPLLYLMHP